MKKLLLAALLFISCHTYGQNYFYYVRPYHLAATVSNPLSLTFKYGGGFENRFRNFAYMVSYFKYIGAYPGTQLDFEARIYLRKRWLMVPSHFTYQHFLWFKGISGDAGYDGPKLAPLGYESKSTLPPSTYYGFGAGIGRRYTKGVFFFTAKAGLKYCAFADLDKEDKNLYRIFYATGPGSILEVQFQFGIQI